MTLATIETTDYLTCAEAADKLGLGSDSIRVYCNNASEGKSPAIHGVKVGNSWLIHKSEISRYKRERREAGRPPRS